jgi:DnaJ-class molecular chaperone
LNRNYYVVLGILSDATADEVKQAYFRLVKLYHPDKNKSPDATIKMAEINVAYETLSDSQTRREYDLEIEVVMQDDQQDMMDEEGGQEPHAWMPGRCIKCNYVSNSGMFVCSVCGNVFDPGTKNKKKNKHSDTVSYDELDDPESEDTLSEIIRCPQCNEINRYSSGSCWQCRLNFEIEETA